jgi:hypothetical protein
MLQGAGFAQVQYGRTERWAGALARFAPLFVVHVTPKTCAQCSENMRRISAATRSATPLFGPLCVVVVVKCAAVRQLAARENFAEFLGQARAGLNKRGKRRLGDLIGLDPSQRGEFADLVASR